MKKIILLLLSFALVFFSFGCGSEKPEIDIEKISDWVSETGYFDSYDYVTDWSITPDGSDGIAINIVVNDGTDPDLAVQVADGIARYVSSAACNQSDQLTAPGKDNYGSLYNYYSALIGVSEQSKVNNTKDWLVFHAIVSDSGPTVGPQE